MKQINLMRPSAAVLTAALASMALYACNQNGQQAATQATPPPALPLTTGAASAPLYAPSVAALPSAPRPKIVRVASQADEFAYVDQAQQMGAALGSAPPDYAFDYDGSRPWVWRTSDNAARFVEPVEGGYRYYYFQPGQSYPYFVQTPQYGYGFNDGQLVVVYDGQGDVLPSQSMDQQADYAGRYLARGRMLYNASLQDQRQSVIAANWAARQAQIEAQQAEWTRERSQYSAWQDYHQDHEAQMQAYWQAERDRRAASASQFNQWRDASYQGAPPAPPPYAGVAGAAVAGGLIGGLIAGQHHDHGGPPPPNYTPQGDQGRPGGPGFDNSRGDQQAAIQQARQQQAQQDTQRQAQAQQQAQAAATARGQAVQQGHRQQAAEDAAKQSTAEQQARQIGAARDQQAAQDTAVQRQQQAAAQKQAEDAQRAQTQQAHQQQLAQAAGRQQGETAARAQAQQNQAAQAAAQHQSQTAARAQAMQAHEQQAAQAAGQRQAEASARAQAAQAHQQQAAQAATQHQAQAAQAAHAATAAHAAPHPNGPPPGGHDPKRDGEPHPAQN